MTSTSSTVEAFATRFLAAPGRFDALCHSASFGEETATLDLPGGPYVLSGLSKQQQENLRSRWKHLVVSDHTARSTQCAVVAVAAGTFEKVATRGFHYELDFQHLSARVRLAGMELIGQIDWVDRRVDATLGICEETGDKFASTVENFLRVLVAYRLVELGGALLHSAAVVARDRATLFIGPSGAGKSTIARLARESGRSVLSDDLNSVLPGEKGSRRSRVVGTPFVGDIERSDRLGESFPLSAGFRLKKTKHGSLSPLSISETIATWISCCPT